MSKLNADMISNAVDKILAFSAGEEVTHDGKPKVGKTTTRNATSVSLACVSCPRCLDRT